MIVSYTHTSLCTNKLKNFRILWYIALVLDSNYNLIQWIWTWEFKTALFVTADLNSS